MLAPASLAGLGPSVWADLGCGDGTFTRALAAQLAPGSTVHAIDRRPTTGSPAGSHRDVAIHVHRGDFTSHPWPFHGIDGVLMANSLHYVRDQPAFLRQSVGQMKPAHRFLVVEYDLAQPNRWVPYPVNRAALADLFGKLGYASIAILGSRPSIYQRAEIYAALII